MFTYLVRGAATRQQLAFIWLSGTPNNYFGSNDTWNDNNVYCDCGPNGGGGRLFAAGNSVSPHQTVFVRNGSNGRIERNGTSVVTSTTMAGTLAGTTAQFTYMNETGLSRSTDGVMPELVIWNSDVSGSVGSFLSGQRTFWGPLS
jgi:hypothetical protein